MRNLSLTTWLSLGGLTAVFAAVLVHDHYAFGVGTHSSVAPPQGDQAVVYGRLVLPPAPERALVETYCQDCHHLSRIEKSGGDVAAWTSRIDRMIRGGAELPRDQIPLVASYLANSLPVRPREVGDEPDPAD